MASRRNSEISVDVSYPKSKPPAAKGARELEAHVSSVRMVTEAARLAEERIAALTGKVDSFTRAIGISLGNFVEFTKQMERLSDLSLSAFNNMRALGSEAKTFSDTVSSIVKASSDAMKAIRELDKLLASPSARSGQERAQAAKERSAASRGRKAGGTQDKGQSNQVAEDIEKRIQRAERAVSKLSVAINAAASPIKEIAASFESISKNSLAISSAFSSAKDIAATVKSAAQDVAKITASFERMMSVKQAVEEKERRMAAARARSSASARRRGGQVTQAIGFVASESTTAKRPQGTQRRRGPRASLDDIPAGGGVSIAGTYMYSSATGSRTRPSRGIGFMADIGPTGSGSRTPPPRIGFLADIVASGSGGGSSRSRARVGTGTIVHASFKKGRKKKGDEDVKLPWPDFEDLMFELNDDPTALFNFLADQRRISRTAADIMRRRIFRSDIKFTKNAAERLYELFGIYGFVDFRLPPGVKGVSGGVPALRSAVHQRTYGSIEKAYKASGDKARRAVYEHITKLEKQIFGELSKVVGRSRNEVLASSAPFLYGLPKAIHSIAKGADVEEGLLSAFTPMSSIVAKLAAGNGGEARELSTMDVLKDAFGKSYKEKARQLVASPMLMERFSREVAMLANLVTPQGIPKGQLDENAYKIFLSDVKGLFEGITEESGVKDYEARYNKLMTKVSEGVKQLINSGRLTFSDLRKGDVSKVVEEISKVFSLDKEGEDIDEEIEEAEKGVEKLSQAASKQSEDAKKKERGSAKKDKKGKGAAQELKDLSKEAQKKKDAAKKNAERGKKIKEKIDAAARDFGKFSAAAGGEASEDAKKKLDKVSKQADKVKAVLAEKPKARKRRDDSSGELFFTFTGQALARAADLRREPTQAEKEKFLSFAPYDPFSKFDKAEELEKALIAKHEGLVSRLGRQLKSYGIEPELLESMSVPAGMDISVAKAMPNIFSGKGREFAEKLMSSGLWSELASASAIQRFMQLPADKQKKILDRLSKVEPGVIVEQEALSRWVEQAKQLRLITAKKAAELQKSLRGGALTQSQADQLVQAAKAALPGPRSKRAADAEKHISALKNTIAASVRTFPKGGFQASRAIMSELFGDVDKDIDKIIKESIAEASKVSGLSKSESKKLGEAVSGLVKISPDMAAAPGLATSRALSVIEDPLSIMQSLGLDPKNAKHMAFFSSLREAALRRLSGKFSVEGIVNDVAAMRALAPQYMRSRRILAKKVQFLPMVKNRSDIAPSRDVESRLAEINPYVPSGEFVTGEEDPLSIGAYKGGRIGRRASFEPIGEVFGLVSRMAKSSGIPPEPKGALSFNDWREALRRGLTWHHFAERHAGLAVGGAFTGLMQSQALMSDAERLALGGSLQSFFVSLGEAMKSKKSPNAVGALAGKMASAQPGGAAPMAGMDLPAAIRSLADNVTKAAEEAVNQIVGAVRQASAASAAIKKVGEMANLPPDPSLAAKQMADAAKAEAATAGRKGKKAAQAGQVSQSGAAQPTAKSASKPAAVQAVSSAASEIPAAIESLGENISKAAKKASSLIVNAAKQASEAEATISKLSKVANLPADPALAAKQLSEESLSKAASGKGRGRAAKPQAQEPPAQTQASAGAGGGRGRGGRSASGGGAPGGGAGGAPGGGGGGGGRKRGGGSGGPGGPDEPDEPGSASGGSGKKKPRKGKAQQAEPHPALQPMSMIRHLQAIVGSLSSIFGTTASGARLVSEPPRYMASPAEAADILSGLGGLAQILLESGIGLELPGIAQQDELAKLFNALSSLGVKPPNIARKKKGVVAGAGRRFLSRFAGVKPDFESKITHNAINKINEIAKHAGRQAALASGETELYPGQIGTVEHIAGVLGPDAAALLHYFYTIYNQARAATDMDVLASSSASPFLAEKRGRTLPGRMAMIKSKGRAIARAADEIMRAESAGAAYQAAIKGTTLLSPRVMRQAMQILYSTGDQEAFAKAVESLLRAESERLSYREEYQKFDIRESIAKSKRKAQAIKNIVSGTTGIKDVDLETMRIEIAEKFGSELADQFKSANETLQGEVESLIAFRRKEAERRKILEEIKRNKAIGQAKLNFITGKTRLPYQLESKVLYIAQEHGEDIAKDMRSALESAVASDEQYMVALRRREAAMRAAAQAAERAQLSAQRRKALKQIVESGSKLSFKKELDLAALEEHMSKSELEELRRRMQEEEDLSKKYSAQKTLEKAIDYQTARTRAMKNITSGISKLSLSRETEIQRLATLVGDTEEGKEAINRARAAFEASEEERKKYLEHAQKVREKEVSRMELSRRSGAVVDVAEAYNKLVSGSKLTFSEEVALSKLARTLGPEEAARISELRGGYEKAAEARERYAKTRGAEKLKEKFAATESYVKAADVVTASLGGNEMATVTIGGKEYKIGEMVKKYGPFTSAHIPILQAFFEAERKFGPDIARELADKYLTAQIMRPYTEKRTRQFKAIENACSRLLDQSQRDINEMEAAAEALAEIRLGKTRLKSIELAKKKVLIRRNMLEYGRSPEEAAAAESRFEQAALQYERELIHFRRLKISWEELIRYMGRVFVGLGVFDTIRNAMSYAANVTFRYALQMQTLNIGVTSAVLALSRFRSGPGMGLVASLGGEAAKQAIARGPEPVQLDMRDQVRVAFAEAQSQMRFFKIKSLRFGVPLDQLLEGYQVASGVARQAGFYGTDLVNAISSLVAFSQAMGISMSVLARTIDNVFSGQRIAQVTLGRMLGLSEKKVKEMVTTGRFRSELLNRLKPIEQAVSELGESSISVQWARTTSSLMIYFNQLTQGSADSFARMLGGIGGILRERAEAMILSDIYGESGAGNAVKDASPAIASILGVFGIKYLRKQLSNIALGNATELAAARLAQIRFAGPLLARLLPLGVGLLGGASIPYWITMGLTGVGAFIGTNALLNRMFPPDRESAARAMKDVFGGRLEKEAPFGNLAKLLEPMPSPTPKPGEPYLPSPPRYAVDLKKHERKVLELRVGAEKALEDANFYSRAISEYISKGLDAPAELLSSLAASLKQAKTSVGKIGALYEIVQKSSALSEEDKERIGEIVSKFNMTLENYAQVFVDLEQLFQIIASRVEAEASMFSTRAERISSIMELEYRLGYRPARSRSVEFERNIAMAAAREKERTRRQIGISEEFLRMTDDELIAYFRRLNPAASDELIQLQVEKVKQQRQQYKAAMESIDDKYNRVIINFRRSRLERDKALVNRRRSLLAEAAKQSATLLQDELDALLSTISLATPLQRAKLPEMTASSDRRISELTSLQARAAFEEYKIAMSQAELEPGMAEQIIAAAEASFRAQSAKIFANEQAMRSSLLRAMVAHYGKKAEARSTNVELVTQADILGRLLRTPMSIQEQSRARFELEKTELTKMPILETLRELDVVQKTVNKTIAEYKFQLENSSMELEKRRVIERALAEAEEQRRNIENERLKATIRLNEVLMRQNELTLSISKFMLPRLEAEASLMRSRSDLASTLMQLNLRRGYAPSSGLVSRVKRGIVGGKEIDLEALRLQLNLTPEEIGMSDEQLMEYLRKKNPYDDITEQFNDLRNKILQYRASAEVMQNSVDTSIMNLSRSVQEQTVTVMNKHESLLAELAKQRMQMAQDEVDAIMNIMSAGIPATQEAIGNFIESTSKRIREISSVKAEVAEREYKTAINSAQLEPGFADKLRDVAEATRTLAINRAIMAQYDAMSSALGTYISGRMRPMDIYADMSGLITRIATSGVLATSQMPASPGLSTKLELFSIQQRLPVLADSVEKIALLQAEVSAVIANYESRLREQNLSSAERTAILKAQSDAEARLRDLEVERLKRAAEYNELLAQENRLRLEAFQSSPLGKLMRGFLSQGVFGLLSEFESGGRESLMAAMARIFRGPPQRKPYQAQAQQRSSVEIRVSDKSGGLLSQLGELKEKLFGEKATDIGGADAGVKEAIARAKKVLGIGEKADASSAAQEAAAQSTLGKVGSSVGAAYAAFRAISMSIEQIGSIQESIRNLKNQVGWTLSPDRFAQKAIAEWLKPVGLSGLAKIAGMGNFGKALSSAALAGVGAMAGMFVAGPIGAIIGGISGGLLGGGIASAFGIKPPSPLSRLKRGLQKVYDELGIPRDAYGSRGISDAPAFVSDVVSEIGLASGQFLRKRYPGLGQTWLLPARMASILANTALAINLAREDAESLAVSVSRRLVPSFESGFMAIASLVKRGTIGLEEARVAVGGLARMFFDLPPIVDTGRLAIAALGRDGKLSFKALERAAQDASTLIARGLPDALRQAVEAGGEVSQMAVSLGNTFADMFIQRVSERILQRKELGAALSEMVAVSEQAAEFLAAGQYDKYNQAMSRVYSLFASSQMAIAMKVSPIVNALTAIKNTFGIGTPGVFYNQVGYTIPEIYSPKNLFMVGQQNSFAYHADISAAYERGYRRAVSDILPIMSSGSDDSQRVVLQVGDGEFGEVVSGVMYKRNKYVNSNYNFPDVGRGLE